MNKENKNILKKGQRTCPKCGSNWDGDLILESFIKQRENGECFLNKSDKEIEDYIKENYCHPYKWGREIGIELPLDHPKHYDGISYWQCPDCKATFNRFSGLEETI